MEDTGLAASLPTDSGITGITSPAQRYQQLKEAIMVLTSDYRTQIPLVIDAVNSGDLAQRVIDTACTRVLVWKMSLGLL